MPGGNATLTLAARTERRALPVPQLPGTAIVKYFRAQPQLRQDSAGISDIRRLHWSDALRYGFYRSRASIPQCEADPADLIARVVELADTPDLGSGSVRSGGSSPLVRTILYWEFR